MASIYRMLDTKIVLTVVGLTTMAYIYNRVKEKEHNVFAAHDDSVIDQYLVNGDAGNANKKSKNKNNPFLWVYNSYDANSRHWKTFNDRKSNDLNQPYIELCLQSIIHKNSDNFNVCLISDSSFKKLLPELNFDIAKIPAPLKNHYQTLALMKIAHRYGGLVMPSSMICFKNLRSLYNRSIREHSAFCFEFPNHSLTVDYERLLPSSKILGCERYNTHIRDIIHKYEEVLSEDFTSESDILGKLSHFIMMSEEKGNIKVLSGQIIGTRDVNNRSVTLEKLFSTDFLQLSNDAMVLYIPQQKIKERNAFSWFCRLSPQQIYESNIYLCRLFLISQGNIYQSQESCAFSPEI